MKKREKQYRNAVYYNIIKDKLGDNFYKQQNEIKTLQCSYCKKRLTNICRLEIQNNKCINYAERH